MRHHISFGGFGTHLPSEDVPSRIMNVSHSCLLTSTCVTGIKILSNFLKLKEKQFPALP
jgi:hypothetical protein